MSMSVPDDARTTSWLAADDRSARSAVPPACPDPVTVVRHHLDRRELCRLTGLVPLPCDSLIEFGDGRIARVVAVRLMVDTPTSGQGQLFVDVSFG